jgi:serine/threonine protein kinase
VAEALAYAHSQGVVHRDIKPANVMVDLSRDLVKVTDFGIARISDSSRTRTGMVLGTPSFMSPEQMAGLRVDGRSDLYSLGVMLFQLLTGLLPHRSESMATLMHQIANEPAPDVRTLRPELPEMLADVVTLAVEKRPEVRYADGRQMASDLRQIASLMDAVALAPPPAVGSPPPDSSGFTETVKFDRADPRHNS